MRSHLKVSLAGVAAVMAVALSAPASASSVVATDCISVADADGCLFNGNINGNSDPSNVNGYVNAQNAYNLFNDTHPTAQHDITLCFLTKSDDANFGTFGSITGGGTSSGTWSMPGFLVNFIAVKAGDQFVLYQITPASSGSWKF